MANAIPAAAAVAIIGLAAMALNSAANREADVRATVEDDLTEQLRAHIQTWEAGVVTRLETIVDDVHRQGIDLAEAENMLRLRHLWFDSLYVWTIPTVSGDDGRSAAYGPAWSFPFAIDPTAKVAARHPCVIAARTMTPVVVEPVPREMALFLGSRVRHLCDAAPLAQQLYASAEAARYLLDAGHGDAGLHAMRVAGFDDKRPWRSGVGGELPIYLRVWRRLLLGELLIQTGDTTTGARLLVETVRLAASLDVPALEAVLYLLPRALTLIEGAGYSSSTLQEKVLMAERRVVGFRELETLQRLPLARTATSTSGARFEGRHTGDDPFALYISPASMGQPGVAVLIDQISLVEDFLRHGAGRFRDHLSVVDLTGRVVQGPRVSSGLAVEVSFAGTMRYLRVGLSEDVVNRRVAALADRGVFWTKLITVLCALLGAGALIAQGRAEQRHRMLLQRQREFTTRVTHELKTPLAGIRVMAENIAMGAYRDDAQRNTMVERIVDEADRLTERVEEILRVARDKDLPEPELVDLEEVLLDLLQTWGPRYEGVGIQLSADFDVVDEVMAVHDALRDAVGCLLDNALKYRREDRDSLVWLNLRDRGSTAEIEVVDNGLGVPREHRTAIFEPYVRVEGDNRGKSGGHGLGLAQVARTMERHGGTVRCEEGVDGGARFVLRLPIG